jgi:molybdopterin-guanine dinucleotide biosynthesis protein A
MVEAYVLAGGKSSRMGQEKGLAIVNQKPMIEHILASLADLTLPTRIITANQSYARFGLPLVADPIPNMGPLGGLYTALQHTQAQWVLMLSCDMPLLTTEILKPLIVAQEKDNLLYYKVAGQIFPFPACYHSSLKTKVLKLIQEKKLKITSFLEETNPKPISLTEEKTMYFTNANHPDDIAQLEKTWPK